MVRCVALQSSAVYDKTEILQDGDVVRTCERMEENVREIREVMAGHDRRGKCWIRPGMRERRRGDVKGRCEGREGMM